MGSEALMTKLRQLLHGEFEGADLHDFGPSTPGERIGGVLVWDGFRDMDQLDRQGRVWDALRRQLEPEAQLSVGLIMTLAPNEWEAITAD